MSVDVNQQIGHLEAANTKPVAVSPDESLDKAISKMLLNDFSQLPVMTGEREVKGIVSWKSIGTRLALRQDCKLVRQCLDRHNTINRDRPIREAIPIILSHDCVLVRDGSKVITGIVTAADICLQYDHLTGPFLLLGEIEINLRKLIGSKLTCEDLAAAKDPNDQGRVIGGIADLSLGEAVRLLNNPGIWNKLDLALDRAEFGKKLDSIRVARNKVMHFDPSGITGQMNDELSEFAKALRVLLNALCR